MQAASEGARVVEALVRVLNIVIRVDLSFEQAEPGFTRLHRRHSVLESAIHGLESGGRDR